MVPFAGYNMPLQYEGLKAEHLAVRKSVGVFDVSHMGEFMVRGAGAKALVQKISSNDVEQLYDGRVQYSCMPNETGGIVDDLLVYRVSDDEFMLVVNASNIDKDWAHISNYKTDDVEMKNISDDITLLAVQGPNATAVLSKLTHMDLEGMVYYHFQKGKFAGVDDVLVSTTGYTGSGGFEVYFSNEHAVAIWNAVFEAGEAYGIKPAGFGKRYT
jgi:aminomethyltransferase